MCMIDTNAQPDEEQSLMRELLLLVDDFAAYSYVSVFLCGALAEVMSSDEPLQQEKIEGAKICVEMLQSRRQQLKQNLSHAFERYRQEQGKTDSPDL